MSAASMAAMSRPMSPTGTNPPRNFGMARRVSPPTASGARVASAAMPQSPGMTKRHTKKNEVPTYTRRPVLLSFAALLPHRVHEFVPADLIEDQEGHREQSDAHDDELEKVRDQHGQHAPED